MSSYSYYYFDEQNDDFANNGIDGKDTPADFEYFLKALWYRTLQPVVYYFFLLLFSVVMWFSFIPFVNVKVLKKRRDMKKGYFIYGNHTSWVPDVVSSAVTAFPRQCYTICNPDAISIKGAGTLIHMFGAMPTPSSLKTYRSFTDGIKQLYEKGCPISIFPEAHIWPKYNDIRKFSSVSFSFPVELDAPCFTKTTVYIRKKDGTTRSKMIFDGPFYPDPTLDRKAAKDELCERIYNQMKKRCGEYESALDCRYSYTKVDSAEEVRSVIE